MLLGCQKLEKLLYKILYKKGARKMLLNLTLTKVSCENYDEFLTALDVNEVWKKAALTSTPVMEVSPAVLVT